MADAGGYYQILGIGAEADSAAIHAAYRAQAKRLHPDAPGGNAEAFRRLDEAYRALKDPGRRAFYNAALSAKLREEVYREQPAISRLDAWLNALAAFGMAALTTILWFTAAVLDGISRDAPGWLVSVLGWASVPTGLIAWRIFADRKRPFRNPILSLWDAGIILVVSYFRLLWACLAVIVIGTALLWMMGVLTGLWRHLH